MNRLTEPTKDCFKYCLKDHKAVPGEFGTYEAFFDYSMAVKKLGAYEDTGMEPEEIISAVDMAKIACSLHELNAYKDLCTIDHIRDLIKAERDGRLVVLPCGENAELERDGYIFKADHWNHVLTAFRESTETNSGMQVALFNTKEAEAALSADGLTP